MQSLSYRGHTAQHHGSVVTVLDRHDHVVAEAEIATEGGWHLMSDCVEQADLDHELLRWDNVRHPGDYASTDHTWRAVAAVIIDRVIEARAA